MLREITMKAPLLGPGEAGFRLDKLREAWNALRNDIGYGLVLPPGVTLALAEEVGKKYEAWRGWYNEAAASLQNVAAVHWGSEFSRQLDDWTGQYAELRSKVEAALGRTAAPALVPLSKPDLDKDLRRMVTWGAVGGFGLAMFWIWLRRPRSAAVKREVARA